MYAERGLRQNISRERNEEHLRFFVNQLFHIVLVAQKNKLPYDPWKHMCIGSDFDGFIRAIDTCRKISQLSNFGPQLGNNLKALAEKANISLPRSAKEIAEDLLFNNAYEFIHNYFNSKP